MTSKRPEKNDQTSNEIRKHRRIVALHEKNYELREELLFTKKELNTTKTYLNKILTLLDQMGIDIQVVLETHETFKEPDV